MATLPAVAPATAARPARVRPTPPAHRLHAVAAALVVIAISFLRGPAPAYVYDAAQYWSAPVALLSGLDVVEAGALGVRGAFTAIVYLPPAVLSLLFGHASVVWLVVAWNAVIAAVLCAVVIPGIAYALNPTASGRPLHRQVWASALIGAVVLSGFAPFPMMDVAASTLALAGLWTLLSARSPWASAGAGLALSLAVNLRPALAVAVLLAAAVLVARRPRVLALTAAGAGVPVLVQGIVNLAAWGEFDIAPRATAALSGVQARFATYALRYDTVAFVDRHPQQWYCDADYASRLVHDAVPHSQIDVLASAAAHLPDSLWFLTRKITASVHWSFGTPYEHAPDVPTDLMAPAIALLASIGLVWILARVSARRTAPARLLASSLFAFWFGTAGTLAFTTPETRFALPLVLVGLIGTVGALGITTPLPERRRPTIAFVTVVLALTAFVFLSGAEAMTHAVPAGPLEDARSCASMP